MHKGSAFSSFLISESVNSNLITSKEIIFQVSLFSPLYRKLFGSKHCQSKIF